MKRNLGAVLIVLGVFLLIFALNLLFLSDRPEEEESEFNANRSSYRASPYGTLALYSFLQESGYDVTRYESPYTQLESTDDIGTLIVISPMESYLITKEENESLSNWVESGKLLIVVDKYLRLHLGTEFRAGAHYKKGGTEVSPSQPSLYTEGVKKVIIPESSARLDMDYRNTVVHIEDESGPVVADAKFGRGRVICASEPFIASNNGIDAGDNLILILNLLKTRPAGRIAFDEYHHGYNSRAMIGGASRGLIAYFRGTPVPWMVLQGLFIGLLIVYTVGRRFASPLPARRERRTTNLEFVSSMANIVRLARATDLAMSNIYSEFRRCLCRYAGVSTKTDTPSLIAIVAKKAKLSERDLRHLLARCERVAAGGKVSDSELHNLTIRLRQIESDLKL